MIIRDTVMEIISEQILVFRPIYIVFLGALLLLINKYLIIKINTLFYKKFSREKYFSLWFNLTLKVLKKDTDDIKEFLFLYYSATALYLLGIMLFFGTIIIVGNSK